MEVLRKTDIHKILLIIRSNYETAYNFKTTEEASLLIDFWYESLNPYPRNVVIQAVYSAIRNCDYAPRISNILREVKLLQNANKFSHEELWAKLKESLYEVNAAAAYLRYSQYSKWANEKLDKIFEDLPEELKLYLVNISQLIAIANMNEEDLKYERYRFFKALPRLLEQGEARQQAEQFIRLCDGDLRLFIEEYNGKKDIKN